MPDLIELRKKLTGLGDASLSNNELLKFIIVILLHCFFLKLQENDNPSGKQLIQADFDSLSNLYQQCNEIKNLSPEDFAHFFEEAKESTLVYLEKLL